MDPGAAMSSVRSIQTALSVLATLGLTNYLYTPINGPLNSAHVRNKNFDMIVVGGGTSGCLLASRLSEDPNLDVLLIEAGGLPQLEALVPGLLPYLEDSAADYNFTSQQDGFIPVLHKNKEYHMTQGKMLTGTDGMNYMVYVRGDPEDYNSWAEAAGDNIWAYENVLPYFKKSENLSSPDIMSSPYRESHGTTGNIKVTKMDNDIVEKYFLPIQQLGYERVLDTNGNITLGFTQPLVSVAEGNRYSSAFAFLKPAKNRRNLHILTNAQVTKINFDDTKRATGVEVILESGETFCINAQKEVILTAGAINTAKILMLSGIGPKAELEKFDIKVIADLPVGENFQDHRMVPLVFKGLQTDVPTPPQDPGKVPVNVIAGFVSVNKSKNYADYEVLMIVNPHDSPALTQLCSYTFKYIDEVCQKIADAGKGREVLFTFIDHLLPLSRGRVILKSNDSRDDPLIYPGFYSNNEDLINHATYVKDFSRLVDTDYMKSIGSEMIDVSGCSNDFSSETHNSTAFWQCYVLRMATTVWHYSSTCSMGTVVDSRLKFLGVKGLRAADASIMPYITRGNTAAPVYMIAEMAADIIKQDHRTNDG